MPRYLSDEWIDELDAAAQAHPSLVTATQDVDLVIQQEVTGGPDGDVAFHVAVDHGSVRFRSGRAPEADVTFTQDHGTAVAVGTGELSAQTAFMIGKLRITGDVEALMRHMDAFDGVEDVFESVRASTAY